MKTSIIMTLVAIFSMVSASVTPSLEPRPTRDDNCSKFDDPRVESLCEAACKEYGEKTDYILGQCGRKGGKFTYIEGQSVIHLANELFGFNGWTSELRSLTVDFMDEIDGRINVGVSAIVRITLKDGTFHEDIGYGSMENSKSKAVAMEKAKKEAATDALKRTLRMFGNVLGNCIYDKNYTSRMQYVKTPGLPQLDIKNLYRDKRCVQPTSPQKPSPQQQQEQPLKSNYSIPGTATFSPAGTLVASHSSNNNSKQTSTTMSSRATVPRLTRSTSRQLQEQSALATNTNRNNMDDHFIASKKTTTTPTQNKKLKNNNNYNDNNYKNDDTLVVSPLPPNQAPPLRSSLSRNGDSFSIEGDDEFLAEVIALEKDYDKPDIESQPISDDHSFSGDLKRDLQGNNKRKLM